MSLHNDIRAALEQRLAGTPGLPASRSWEAVPFFPVEGAAFVVAMLRPTSRRAVTFGTSPLYRHSGLFLVEVAYPHGTGAAAADAMADVVVARFPVPLDLPQNGVVVGIRYSERGAGLRDAGWFKVPVTIAWRVDSYTP